jgi:hypothetical protein
MKKTIGIFVLLLSGNVFASGEWTMLPQIATKKIFDEIIDISKVDYEYTVRQWTDGCQSRADGDTLPYKKTRVAFRFTEKQISTSESSIHTNFICEMAYVQ